MDILLFQSEDYNLENYHNGIFVEIKHKRLTKHKTTFSVKTVYAYIHKHYVSFLYLSVCGDHTMLVNTAV